MFTCILDKLRTWKSAHRSMLVEFPTDAQLKARTPLNNISSGLIVAFYTKDAIYEAEIRRMEASAKRLGLKVEAEAVESVGSWVRNASMKAQFLANQRTLHRGPLLYVDADAVFHDNPWPYLNTIHADIQVHYEPSGHLLSGTIWIADTDNAQKLLNEWAERCNVSPDEWDQLVLEKIIAEDREKSQQEYKISVLPLSYCWIFDKEDNEEINEVFIEHLQASREAKAKRRRFMIRKKLKRRRQRTLEIERILFK